MLLAQLLAEHQAGAQTVVVQSGYGLGSILAVTCSWDRNKSILWAIIAALFSWVYVIWYAVTRSPGPSL